MQKAHSHLHRILLSGLAPIACKRIVSGLFHSAVRGSFHLSLTVLVHYRSLVSI
jgi:hypothetical protein